MNRKILVGILAIGLVALAVGWGTYSQFSDTETSTTTFSAGSLDLTINNKNGETVTFSASDLRPGDQPHYSLTLKNIGTIKGNLSISNIVVVSGENVRTEPEIEAGDTSDDTGELDDVLNIRLFLDYDHDGWIGSQDKVFFDGLVKNLPSAGFDLKEPIEPGGGVDFVVEIYDWWAGRGAVNDNQAQTDTLSITFTFLLVQAP
jgi:predicted ribosomally synthesized peptide with SipW-like signal peptide